jgi:hypothetical protein
MGGGALSPSFGAWDQDMREFITTLNLDKLNMHLRHLFITLVGINIVRLGRSSSPI